MEPWIGYLGSRQGLWVVERPLQTPTQKTMLLRMTPRFRVSGLGFWVYRLRV